MTARDTRGVSELGALGRLAHSCGVQEAYTDVTGRRHGAEPDSIMAVLRAMGVPISRIGEAVELERGLAAARADRLVEPVVVRWIGQTPAPVPIHAAAEEVILEDERGRRRRWSLATGAAGEAQAAGASGERLLFDKVPTDLEIGVHTLIVRAGGREERVALLAAPSKCVAPGSRGGHRPAPAVGTFLPLYAAQSAASAGIGDMADLCTLLEWTATHSGRYFGTLPLLTCFLDEPFEPSPYAPVSRLVLGEIFLDLRHLQGPLSEEAIRLLDSSELREEIRALRRGDSVDYRRVWNLKRRLLAAMAEAAFAHEATRREIEQFETTHPVVSRYARFRGAMSRLGASRGVWKGWPRAARRGDLREDDVDEVERRLFLYAQWQVRQQMSGIVDAGKRCGCSLYMDLPIGVHADGFDVWERQTLFAAGVQLGAPPDAFFAGGQAWGFPPVIPDRSRAEGHEYVRACIEAHARHAGALRIDHVAGLHRCFWVPDGMSPKEGVYVRQPAEEIYAMLAIASHRFSAVIVGENLGTVPPEVNRSLRKRGVLGMNIAQFELGGVDPLPRPDGGNLAALNTHDLPPFAAYWTGSDIDLNVRLGLFDEARATSERAQRREMRQKVGRALGVADPDNADPAQVARMLLAHLAGGEADVLLVNLEDLWGEDRPHNVPGMAYPLTWRRRAALTLERICGDDALGHVVESLTDAGAPSGAGGGAGAQPVRNVRLAHAEG